MLAVLGNDPAIKPTNRPMISEPFCPGVDWGRGAGSIQSDCRENGVSISAGAKRESVCLWINTDDLGTFQ